MRIRFEQGTLVCEADDDGDDLSSMPGAVWDDEHRAWRLAAERYAATLRWLIAHGVRFSDDLPSWRITVRWEVPLLHWYQSLALERWRAAEMRGVIAVPAGPPRIVLALAAIARLGLSTLCLVPSVQALEPWRRALAEGTGLHVGRLGDGSPDIASLTVATFASAARWATEIGDHFGLLIIDEAHHVGAACPSELLDLLVAPARLGLTSLPPESPALLERQVGPVVHDRAHEPTEREAPIPSTPPDTPAPPHTLPLGAAIDRVMQRLIGRSRATIAPFLGDTPRSTAPLAHDAPFTEGAHVTGGLP